MMLFGIVMLYVMIQESAACWSTVIVQVINATAVPPFLTSEQADTLYMLSQELDKLSCQELQETVYNTTTPPIQLSDSQMDELENFYSEFFKTDDSRIGQCGTRNNPRKRSTVDNVCSFSIVDQRLNLALDKHGQPVYVPQGVKYGLEQIFKENKCTNSACTSSLQCSCQDEFSHTAMAVVTYIKNNDPKFYEAEIQLRSCLAYHY